MSFKDYIINTYEKYFDLTEGRLFTLNQIMNRCAGDKVTVSDFVEYFCLEDMDFMSILKFISIYDNQEELSKFGSLVNQSKNVKTIG